MSGSEVTGVNFWQFEKPLSDSVVKTVMMSITNDGDQLANGRTYLIYPVQNGEY